MGFSRSPDAIHASGEGRIAPSWSFRYLGCANSHGGIITSAFFAKPAELGEVYIDLILCDLIYLLPKGALVDG